MKLAAVKEKLHDYIEHADEKKVKAMFTLVENDMEPDYEFSEAELAELDRRWENYLSGKEKSYSLEDSMSNMRKYIENKRKNAI